MKQVLSFVLFCALCFSSCGVRNNNEKKNDNQQKDVVVEEVYERTSKDDAKDLALEAKKEYEQNRDFEKAIELFEKAIEIDGGEEWMYADMARVKMEIRDYEGAIKDLKKAMELKEKNSFEENKEE
jgi:tetratricopeptide (TPR) repeat protein